MRFSFVDRIGKVLPVFLLSSCALIIYLTPHPITLYSLDGEVLKGEYVFTGRMKGNVKVTRIPGGEVLTGEFTSVDNTTFSQGYSQSFGRAFGSASGPTGSAFGSAQASAYGQSVNVTTGGQFQGMGILTGEGTVIQCFYVGSMRTNNGFGKCKSNKGKEYDLQF